MKDPDYSNEQVIVRNPTIKYVQKGGIGGAEQRGGGFSSLSSEQPGPLNLNHARQQGVQGRHREPPPCGCH